VFDTFARAKRHYVESLKADGIEKPTEVDEVHRRVMEITGDPLPYGIAPNRKVVDELIRHALTQGIISKPVTADELFAPSTRALVG
jgi:4,5-dihydroxyphthalate decarboxylase